MGRGGWKGDSPFRLLPEKYGYWYIYINRPGSAGKILGWKCWKMRYSEPKISKFSGGACHRCPPNHPQYPSGYAPARLPQSNGQAERTVQTIKHLLQKTTASGQDPYLALLAHCNTPVADLSFTPAQLLMSRRLRDTLPASPASLTPSVPPVDVQHTLAQRTAQQKARYDQHATSLPPLAPGQHIHYSSPGNPNSWQPGQVFHSAATPRSYIISTASGRHLWRNHRHLYSTPPPPQQQLNIQEGEEDEDLVHAPVPAPANPVQPPPQPAHPVQPPANPPPVVTRSGRVVNPPQRYQWQNIPDCCLTSTHGQKHTLSLSLSLFSLSLLRLSHFCL